MAYKKLSFLGPELFTVDEVKPVLGLDPSYEPDNEYNDFISLCIIAAREKIEQDITRLLAPAKMLYVADSFKPVISLFYTPFVELISIEYVQPDGTKATIAPEDVIIDDVSEPARLMHVSGVWPSTRKQLNAVKIIYKAGFDSTEQNRLPELLKKGALYLVNHYFENRDMAVTGTIVNTVPDTYDTIIKGYQIHPVI